MVPSGKLRDKLEKMEISTRTEKQVLNLLKREMIKDSFKGEELDKIIVEIHKNQSCDDLI